jgi:branched-subunit amino acid ABC-type transport system permease component
MALALQIIASGFAAGAVYGLVGVGHSLVFRLTGVVHFAFGDPVLELLLCAAWMPLYLVAYSAGLARVGSAS